MNKPLVSVIVTTKNSAKTLDKCLSSVEDQTYSAIELIVVDNYSTDKTWGIAKKYATFVCSKGPERSAQRNFGVEKSKGKYLLFLDSDMYLSPKVVEECIHKIQTENIVAVFIPEKITGNTYWTKVRNFERSFYNSTAIDAVRFMSKAVFNKAGQFDSELIAGEDWDLDKRIRKIGDTDIIESPLYHNENKMTLHSYLNKKRYYAGYLKKYVDKWGENDMDVQKQLHFMYRFFLVFVEQGKWKKIIQRPDLFIGVIFLKFLIGIQYLFYKNFNIQN